MEAPLLESCTFDEHDKLERKNYALFLTKYMRAKCGDDNHYVFNLNSPWGSGKSHFLRCWHNEIKEQHPVVYYDAWENDYSEQPLTSLLAVIAEQLKTDESEYEQFIGKVSIRLGKFLASKFIDYGAKIISHQVKKHTGIDTESSENLSEELSDFSLELSGYFKKSLLAQIEKKESVADSRSLIRELACSYVTNEKINWPVFVMVDELDRCRPSFAIELLENIKHIFNIPGFVFVIATDSGQLQHSIKRVYGEGFDGDGYLGRFFHRRFYLPAPNLNDFLKNDSEFYEVLSSSGGWNEFNGVDGGNKTEPLDLLLMNIFKAGRLELREVKEVVSSLCSIVYLFRDGGGRFNVPLVAFLLSVNKKSPNLFFLLKVGRLVNFDESARDSTVEEFHRTFRSFSFKLFGEPINALTFFKASLFDGSSIISISKFIDESDGDIVRASKALKSSRYENKHLSQLANYYLSGQLSSDVTGRRERYFELVELSF